MSPRRRLDAELVRRGLAGSRQHAADLVADGRVKVGGLPASKTATGVTTDEPILVEAEDPGPRYASRAAHKLVGALESFASAGLTVCGRRCLDAGASTGGFTDVLLRNDASEVVAVDVGYGQLAWSLRQNDRVRVLDRTNVRALDPETIGGQVDLVVSDLSFISLRVALPALVGVCRPDGDLLLMVKPQFEVGRERVGRKGVVTDPALHLEAVSAVCRHASDLGYGARAVVASPLPGPAGNVEYFGWFRAGSGRVDDDEIATVVRAGPAVGRAAGPVDGLEQRCDG